MIAPYDHKALWTKAKLFVNRAMDEDGTRSFDEQALWASMALELLAKAALARTSPLLIAEPKEDGENLLIASGLIRGDARFVSVQAATLFKRCEKAYKPFSSKEASQFSSARNEYLHGTGVNFLAIPPKAWWPKFWAQTAILIAALDRDIEEFVGPDRENVVKHHLEQNAKNIEHRAEMLIERAKQRLAQYQSGTLTARVAAEWKPGLDMSAGLMYGSTEICPACGSAGKIEGENISDTDVSWSQISEEDYESSITLTVDSEYFSCSTCQLVLDGYELIDHVDLSRTFEIEGDENDIYMEPDYGND